jgi:hypothetical protein
MGMSDVVADLEDVELTSLEISGGASRLEVKLPRPKAAVRVRIGGGASNVELIRPAGVPARVRIGGGALQLATDDFRVGAAGGKTDWRSPEYNLVEDRYDIEIGAGASKVTVRIARGIWLARATHPEVLAAAQDGGLVSALLLWGLQSRRIEGALCSRRSRVRLWDAEPFLATTPAEVLAAAGSRYTYSANALAMRQAERRGLRRLALVGTGCQAAMNGTLRARGVNKYARRIQLSGTRGVAVQRYARS